jgi:hypothetical protein
MSIEHSIETLSGSMFDYDAPAVETIDIEDIVRALGNCCRFGGHVRQYYSVAEHAVLVYRLVRDAGFPADVCYGALHHDSHEAYLIDAPTPLKRKIKVAAPGVWEDLETLIDSAICAALGVKQHLFHHDAVKAADMQALSYEAAVLKPSGTAQHSKTPVPGWVKADLDDVPAWAVQGWLPDQASAAFLNAHRNAAARVRADA